ncbi:MAG: hypothetical protein AB1758_04315 [Candidatus Eremiobacterota bacterium]
MRIECHPAAARPALALGVCLALGVLTSFAWTLAPPWVALPLLGLLFWSVLPFFVVSSYELDDRGVTLQRSGRRRTWEWQRFRCYVSDRNGILLSPYRTASYRDGIRGVFLALPRDQRRRVESLLERRGLPRRGEQRPSS